MLKQDKERVVAEIVERLRTSETLLVADYRGLTHAELDGVRTELLKLGARFAVVKNTLTRRAAEAAGVETLEEFLSGPTAIAFVTEGDATGVAKVLSDTARETRRLTLKGGVVQGRVVDGDAIRELATLPPVDVLRGQLLGAIIGPASSIVGIFAAPLRDLVGVLDARIRQLEEPGADTDAAGAGADELGPSAGEASLAPTAPPEEPIAEESAADVEPGPALPEGPTGGEPAADVGPGPAPPEEPTAEDQPPAEETPAEDQPSAEEPPVEEASPADETPEAEEAPAEKAESETQDEPEIQEEES